MTAGGGGGGGRENKKKDGRGGGRKEARMRKRTRKAVAAMAAAAMAASAAQAAIPAPGAGDEIDARIEEVGEKYLEFYRTAGEEDEDGGWWLSGAFSAFAGSAKTAPAANVAAESAMGYEMEEAAFDGSWAPAPRADGAPSATEEWAPVAESGFVAVADAPVSTFGADVDAASYSSLRRKLLEPAASDPEDPYGSWYVGPDDSAIRIEEMVNYFDYGYAEPEDGERFGISTALSPCPWNEDALLLTIGLKAEKADASAGSDVVLLVDTSGSMFGFDALPLVKKALGTLVERLDEDDVVSLVTYAGSEEVVFEGLDGSRKEEIMDAIRALEARGSTYGEGGIEKAYEIAEKYRDGGKEARVVLCTDGDFNVGISSQAGLKEFISKKRETGIFFSCLGVGSGNYSDVTMETLADAGNGNYFYLDGVREAEKALGKEFESTTRTVAKDAKFQVEFNPETVKGYRLIGYENRALAAADFADDSKDGGEVGSGKAVTVLYEVVPADSRFDVPAAARKYAKTADGGGEASDEIATVSVRSKAPDADESDLQEAVVRAGDVEEIGADASWAAGVAQAGMLMRGSENAGTSTFDGIYDRLKEDPEVMENDEKAEFLFMLRYMKKYVENREAEGTPE